MNEDELKDLRILICKYLKDDDDRIIIDKDGKYICFANTTEHRDSIIKAINCHEKFKIACARAYEGLCTNDPDACDKAIKLLNELTEITEKS